MTKTKTKFVIWTLAYDKPVQLYVTLHNVIRIKQRDGDELISDETSTR